MGKHACFAIAPVPSQAHAVQFYCKATNTEWEGLETRLTYP